ncbi:Uncharacterised protein [Vibrio cholerae]|nr:Uncharacterised protein [Vibrio cholerae]
MARSFLRAKSLIDAPYCLALAARLPARLRMMSVLSCWAIVHILQLIVDAQQPAKWHCLCHTDGEAAT